MKKVFLDTNIFLRFFVPTDAEKHYASKEVVLSIEKGRLKAYTSSIVFLECYYVLTSLYKVPRDRVREILTRIAEMRNMTIREHSHTRKAIALWKQTGVKFTDCLITTQIPKGVTLLSYDGEFAKLPVLLSTPERFVKSA